MGLDYDAVGMVAFSVTDDDIYERVPIKNPEGNYAGCSTHDKDFGGGEFCSKCGTKISIIKSKKYNIIPTPGYLRLVKKEWDIDPDDASNDDDSILDWREDFQQDIGKSFDDGDVFWVGEQLGSIGKYDGGGSVSVSLDTLNERVAKVNEIKDLLLGPDSDRNVEIVTGLWIG